MTLAAVLLPAAVCCVKIDTATQESRVALSYNAVLEQPRNSAPEQSGGTASEQSLSTATEQPRTKAATAYSESVPFKSWAWYLPEGKAWAKDAAEAVPYFEDATISFDNGLWHNLAQSYYWPKNGSLSFASYSPASIPVSGATGTTGVGVTRDGLTLTGWKLNASTNQDIDFMVADFRSDLKTNANTYGYLGVPTLFRHKLAKLSILASTASVPAEGIVTRIRKISLKNVFTLASYSSTWSGESWSGRGVPEEIVIYKDDDTASSGQIITEKAFDFTGDAGLLVIPQVLNAYTSASDSRTEAVSVSVEYSYYDSSKSTTVNTSEKTFEGIKSYLWAIGYHYTYNLVVGEENEPIEFDAGVSDWNDGGSYIIRIGDE